MYPRERYWGLIVSVPGAGLWALLCYHSLVSWWSMAIVGSWCFVLLRDCLLTPTPRHIRSYTPQEEDMMELVELYQQMQMFEQALEDSGLTQVAPGHWR